MGLVGLLGVALIVPGPPALANQISTITHGGKYAQLQVQLEHDPTTSGWTFRRITKTSGSGAVGVPGDERWKRSSALAFYQRWWPSPEVYSEAFSAGTGTDKSSPTGLTTNYVDQWNQDTLWQGTAFETKLHARYSTTNFCRTGGSCPGFFGFSTTAFLYWYQYTPSGSPYKS